MSNIYKWLNKEKSRFYTISIQKHHDNEIILSHSWGSCTSNRGGKKNLFVSSEEEMTKFMFKMMKRRKSHGYELIAPVLVNSISGVF